MMTYHFYWSPDGHRIASVTHNTHRSALALFKRRFKTYARFMGEVYSMTTSADHGMEVGDVR